MRTTVASDAIVQEITIKASAERIFEALTNPDQRVKWWGSEGAVPDHAHGVRPAPRRSMVDAGHRHGRAAVQRGRRVSEH